MQAARKEQGLRLSDAARELRISADYLKLLELGDFDQVPAPTYVSGFLRTYGKFLGLDGADLAGRFYAIIGGASSKMDYKLPVTAGPPPRSAPAVASLFVLLAVVGYGGWYWISGRTIPDASVKRELAVVGINPTQPGEVARNAIEQKLETAADTTSGAVLAAKDATVETFQDAVEKTATLIKAPDGTATAPNVATSPAMNAETVDSLSPDSSTLASNGVAEQVVKPDEPHGAIGCDGWHPACHRDR